MILSQLIPMNIDIWVSWIMFFDVPPRSIVFEDIFDQRTVISLADVQDIGFAKLLRNYF